MASTSQAERKINPDVLQNPLLPIASDSRHASRMSAAAAALPLRRRENEFPKRTLLYRMSFAMTAVPTPPLPLLKGRKLGQKEVHKLPSDQSADNWEAVLSVTLRQNKTPESPCHLLKIGRARDVPCTVPAAEERERLRLCLKRSI